MPRVAVAYSLWVIMGAGSVGCQAIIDLEYGFGASDAGVEGASPALQGTDLSRDAGSVLASSCPAGCLIDGTCVTAGELKTSNGCQVCDPVRSGTAWSSYEGACDDGLFCTVSDACRAGECKGEARSCDDGIECNGVSRCDEAAAACTGFTNLCQNGTSCDTASGDCVSRCPDCSVSGVCVLRGAEQAGNPCLVCDPELAEVGFSAALGKACGSGPSICSQQDVCGADGTCQPNHEAPGTGCGNRADSACDHPDSCDGNGGCQSNRVANGDACDDGLFCTQADSCQGGICVQGKQPNCGGGQGCDETANQCFTLFQAIGGLEFRALSGDGSTLAGSAGGVAVRWTQRLGLEVLDVSPETESSVATAVSTDGAVVVGTATLAGVTSPPVPFRWSGQQGMVLIEEAPFGRNNPTAPTLSVSGLSGDGEAFVGIHGCDPYPDCQAYRWAPSTGFVDLGSSGGDYADANAVSADGTVVVGDTGNGTREVAFQWTPAQGFVELPFDPLWYQSHAADVSSDGAIVVGYHTRRGAEFTEQAAYWSSGFASEMSVPLDWVTSEASAVNTDGSMIVGTATTVEGTTAPWLWDRGSNEFRWVKDVLAATGANVEGWTLTSVRISDDGRVLAGSGTGPGGVTTWMGQLR